MDLFTQIDKSKRIKNFFMYWKKFCSNINYVVILIAIILWVWFLLSCIWYNTAFERSWYILICVSITCVYFNHFLSTELEHAKDIHSKLSWDLKIENKNFYEIVNLIKKDNPKKTQEELEKVVWNLFFSLIRSKEQILEIPLVSGKIVNIEFFCWILWTFISWFWGLIFY